jgi:serine/threonine protein kinase, bacterial
MSTRRFLIILKEIQLRIVCKWNVWLLLAVCSLFSCSKTSSSPSAPPSTSGLAISSISPVQGPDSTSVTITGSGFNASPAMNSVYFNGKQAAVTSASTTQLVAIVPSLSGSGNVSVKVNGIMESGPVFTYDTTYLETIFVNNLSDLQDMVRDANGNLYVSIASSNTILKINTSGVVDTFATIPTPQGMVLDAGGNIYVASFSNSWVTSFYKITPGGTSTLIVAYPIVGNAGSLALDQTGNLYAAFTNNSIVEVTPEGVVSTLKTGLPNIFGLVMGFDGNLYATCTTDPNSLTDGIVYKITPSGSTTTFATGMAFCAANGISTDAQGNFIVVNWSNTSPSQSIDKIYPDGTITTMATGFTSDPKKAISDNNGNLFVMNWTTSSIILSGNISKLTPR